MREVFEWEPTEGETWPINDQRIDLALAAREAAVLALPLAPLCSEDCAGPGPDRSSDSGFLNHPRRVGPTAPR